ncbi:MAG: DUF983 domain-containing protein [Flavobacterium sp.]|nr:DUF983 domain-containing protein [Flavobacterium sp.]
MLTKGLKINSILTGSCPRCQKESMYADHNIFHLSNLLKMNETCSHCGLKYQIEPSFFYGAMYVSYGLNVLIMIAVFLISYFGFHAKVGGTFIAIIIALGILFPFVMRLSRNIYINIFVNYDKKFETLF